MKNYGLKNAALLSLSMLIGMSAANAHTTNLSTSIIENCDAVTEFAKNADHNDAKISDAQMKNYIDARVACEVQHQDQHLQSEKHFVNKYGSGK
ncbi:hypothetical protein [Psychrobacter sp. P11G5]|uniref:hypothetical protein n=1 Tax=Psychrobacter sp. P11G5 TaxID=1699624 RepID=UPI00078B41FE|nr:hypothetical protein [Psychrobacter sp. P11G5]AMN67006.1 hypothetical protein AK825_04175 [Psychrobacter sp. P11G5]